ncbi:hypothetical protein [Leifsonia shinshuensis]|uniref:hypothetical protein n=1 Tax=Leifsonia shinshuensis TaxID=150026 RepID=UPI00286725F8|nr:hypothetical protein [Leifsonia shinshuensis]MDR6972301.1 hypothetical protein [Leifsonia shinshuensis]
MARRPDGLVAPEPLDEARTKRVYPPLQWWPLRVMNPWHKFGFLIAYVLGAQLVGRALDLVLPAPASAVVFQIVWTVVLIAMARSFRGFGEPVAAPRAWWRLTARPLAGWLLGALNVIASINALFAPLSIVRSTEDLSSLLLGLAFLNSSIRLHAQRRRPQA